MKIKFLSLWMLFEPKRFLDFTLTLLNNDEGMMQIINLDLTIFNISIIELYIDTYKTNIGLLGFYLQIWYNQKAEEED